MNTPKCDCGSDEVIKYEAVKCKKCGIIIQSFPGALAENKRLKITYDKKANEIWIRGDKNGLEYLASWCLSIIGKNDPSGHIHLQWQTNDTIEGSVETRLEFSDDQEDYS